MPVTVTNRSADARRRYDEAAQKGLGQAATHLVGAIKKAFGSGYYKGGRFRDTLKIRQSIHSLTPYRTSDGAWETQVGTPQIVALYWELGHDNLFTRKHERVPIWAPTAAAETAAMRAVFARVVARLMEQP